jgi:DNA helicase-2/ATP-dependent DNA helicase PcrA
MGWSDGLDPNCSTYRIAADPAARIRVLAGPGTGKSFAIKRRITRLLEGGVAADGMLAITFTRMSAADLVRDIRSVGVDGAGDVHARTLHAECFRILGRNSVIKITGRHPRPLAAFEMEPMFADLRAAASGRDKKAMRALVGAYEAAWARLQHESPGAARTKQDQEFEDALLDWLKFHRAMLIGELVPFAYKYLRDNPAAPERSQYTHVLVDEYQDLNRAEQEVAALLATTGHLIIVGDDDQSIYTFKNAHRIGIIEFPKSDSATNDHTMDICQRCPRLVVSMANSLISRNRSRPTPPRVLKPLAANGDGIVEIFHFKDHDREIYYLLNRIRRFITDGVPPGQIIVLCQSRDYIRPLYNNLELSGVPSKFCYQESEFDEEGATERMALLSLAGDRNDRVSLRYLVGYGPNDWRAAQWSKIRAECISDGKSPWEILAEMATGMRSTVGVKAILDRFREVGAELRVLDPLKGTDLVDAWLPAGSACFELRTLAESVAAEHPDCDAKQLAQKVRGIVLEPDIEEIIPDVRIMSLHKSKGLSANVVIIAGCLEGFLPRQRGAMMTDAEYEESIEESRRLLFVAITRVKASPSDGQPGHLIISASREVPMAIAMKGIASAGKVRANVRTINSRFLDELGPDAPAPVAP